MSARAKTDGVQLQADVAGSGGQRGHWGKGEREGGEGKHEKGERTEKNKTSADEEHTQRMED